MKTKYEKPIISVINMDYHPLLAGSGELESGFNFGDLDNTTETSGNLSRGLDW